MNFTGKYKLVWNSSSGEFDNDNLKEGILYFNQNKVHTTLSKCSPIFHQINIKELHPGNFILKNINIISAYKNGKGYVLVVYENGIVSFSGWNKNIGKIYPVETEPAQIKCDNKDRHILQKINKIQVNSAQRNTQGLFLFLTIIILIAFFYKKN